MNDKHFWFGYLKLGDTQTIVLRDDRLGTGKSLTMYLYNQDRDDLVEYSRQIVEPKLQAATLDEKDAAAIVNAYPTALQRRKPSTYYLLFVMPSAGSGKRKKNSTEQTVEEDIELEEASYGEDEVDWEDSID